MSGLLLVVRFLARYWQASLAVVAVLAFMAMCHARDTAEVNRGKAEERARVADSSLAIYAQQRPAIETTVLHDVRTVTIRTAHVDTLRDSILTHLTDTVRVREFVAASDSAIKACRDVVSSCAQLHRLDSLTIVALRSKVGVTTIPKPRRRCGLGFGGGYGATIDHGVHVGPSLSAGLACSF